MLKSLKRADKHRARVSLSPIYKDCTLRAALIAGVVVLLALMLIGDAVAEGTRYRVQIESGWLNMREEPSTEARVVHKLYSNYVVTASEEKDGWALVSWWGHEDSGWVKTDYLEAMP